MFDRNKRVKYNDVEKTKKVELGDLS